MNTNTKTDGILDKKYKKRCKFVKESGENCGALSMKDSDYCFFHNPKTAAAREESKRNGGKSRIIVVNGKFPEIKIKKVSDVVRLLTDLINGVLSGETDLRIATGITYIANTVLKGLELGEVEKRLAELEEKINSKLNN